MSDLCVDWVCAKCGKDLEAAMYDKRGPDNAFADYIKVRIDPCSCLVNQIKDLVTPKPVEPPPTPTGPYSEDPLKVAKLQKLECYLSYRSWNRSTLDAALTDTLGADWWK